MKKRNKRIIIVSILIILISLIAIGMTYFYTQNEKKKIEEEAIEKRKQELIDEYETKDQYIGIVDCFLGTVNNNNEWNSANAYIEDSDSIFKLGESVKVNVNKKEFTYEDIMNNEDYYLYDEFKYYGKKTDLFYDKDLNPEYYTEIDYFRFNTYQYLNEKNSEEETTGDKKYENFLDFELSKALDSNYSNRITEVEKEKFSEYEIYVKNILDERNVEAEVNINKVILADSDSNGENEIYILANSKMDSEGNFLNEAKGLYSLVLKIENDKTEIILERMLTEEQVKNEEEMYKYFSITGFTLIDFNNDGKLEMVIYSSLWDIPEIYVIRLNDSNEEELCLYGCFAW